MDKILPRVYEGQVVNSNELGASGKVPNALESIAHFKRRSSADGLSAFSTRGTHTAQRPGTSVQGDGSGYGTLVDSNGNATTVTLVGDFDIEFTITTPSTFSIENYILWDSFGTSAFRLTPDQMFRIAVGASALNFNEISVEAGVTYSIHISRSGSDIVITTINTATGAVQEQTRTMSDADF